MARTTQTAEIRRGHEESQPAITLLPDLDALFDQMTTVSRRVPVTQRLLSSLEFGKATRVVYVPPSGPPELLTVTMQDTGRVYLRRDNGYGEALERRRVGGRLYTEDSYMGILLQYTADQIRLNEERARLTGIPELTP